MNNWYARNNKVSPEKYRLARDTLKLKKYEIKTNILEFNNNCKIEKEKLVGDKMNKEDNNRLSSKSIDILFHFDDNPYGADLRCEHSEWMGYDLNQCPGIGEWKCKLQRYEYASDQYGIDSVDYRECKFQDHKKCSVYTKHNGGEQDDKSI